VVESVSPHVSRKYWKFQDTIAMVLWSYLLGVVLKEDRLHFFISCVASLQISERTGGSLRLH
jgi:hypothetical protein